MSRNTTEVIQDHLQKRLVGEVEADIAENFSTDIIILSSFGTFRGHEGVKQCSKKLERDIGNVSFNYNHTQIEEEYAFLEWTASKGKELVCDGADSFVVENGKIVMQTVHYSPPH
jgi:hypothetical protein